MGSSMLVDYSLQEGKVSINFSLDNSDELRISSIDIGMNNEIDAEINLGDVDDVHPDLIALSAILICNPFVGKSLEFAFPISKEFAEGANSVISRYVISSKCDSLPSGISKKRNGVPALAFSGGADSTAALAVMPGNTVPIFLYRPINENSIYNPSAALSICDELREIGYPVKVIESNLEWIREPIGFPTDLANSVPAILLSESLGIESISFGTVLESGFGIGHKKYVDYGEGSHWRFFSQLFATVGLGLSFPVIGVSEVGTALICNNSPNGKFSQSCIRGEWGEPCMSCWKCFRKSLLLFSLGLIEEPDFESMIASKEVRAKLSAFPISHENVVTFAIQRIDAKKFPCLIPLSKKLDLDLDLAMLECWFPDSIDFVVDKYRHSIRNEIIKCLQIMTPNQEGVIRGWDMNEHLKSKDVIESQKRLLEEWDVGI